MCRCDSKFVLHHKFLCLRRNADRISTQNSIYPSNLYPILFYVRCICTTYKYHIVRLYKANQSYNIDLEPHPSHDMNKIFILWHFVHDICMNVYVNVVVISSCEIIFARQLFPVEGFIFL